VQRLGDGFALRLGSAARISASVILARDHSDDRRDRDSQPADARHAARWSARTIVRLKLIA
jgi:hypothetical protein